MRNEERRNPPISGEEAMFFQGVFEATGLAVTVRKLSDLTPLYANPAALTFFGFDSVEEWKGVDAVSHYPEESRRLYFEQVRPALVSEGRWHGDLTLCNSKGICVSAFAHVSILNCNDEHDPCIVSSFQDITARKIAENRMEASEKRYKQLFNEMLSGYALFKMVSAGNGGEPAVGPHMADDMGELECLEINPAFEWITGLNADIIVGRTLSQALSGQQGYMAELAWRVGRTGEAERCERYFPEFDRYLEMAAFVPEPGSVVVTCNDVTSLMSAKDRYKIANEELETMFANSLVGILLLNSDRRILRSNRRVEEILGYAPGELLGKNARDLHLNQENFEQFGESQYSFIAEQRVAQLEYQLRGKNGSPVWCRLYGKALGSSESQTGVIWIVDDISQVKSAERQTSLAKNQFLANMSHEIRTPLNGVLGMLQLLLETSLSSEQRELAATALGSGQSLLAVLNDILDFSKVEAGKIELLNRPFDLFATLDTVFATFWADVSTRGIGLELAMPETGAPDSVPQFLVGDQGRLRQVLLNLVGNAVKFTNQGKVTLSVRVVEKNEDGLLVGFQVEDTGVGIPHNKLDAIFESFTQLDGSFTRRHDGLGLGLGIVRQLTELMGGTVDVSSQVGVGTVFDFTVPLGIVPARSATGADGLPVVAEGTGGASLRVLVAEDDPVNRTLATKLLERLGHEARSVSTGVEVLGELGRRQFDVILMDVQMPQMDGLETVRRIRSGQSGINSKDISVFAITAHAMVGDRERFLEAGMSDYIAKPVDMRELKERLDGVVRANNGE